MVPIVSVSIEVRKPITMPRGPLSEKTKQERLIAAAAELFGTAVVENIEEVVETPEDKIREAQSVLNYFESRGKGFKQRECEQCGLVFAYSYHIDGVVNCSISCMAAKLKSIGLHWDPRRDVSRRWGRFVPAIVPPSALKELDEMLSLQEDHSEDIYSEEEPETL